MQPTCLVEDDSKQLYCIVDPFACLQQAIETPYSSLAECRFCKSLYLPSGHSLKVQCPICHSFNDLKDLPSNQNDPHADILLTEPTATGQHRQAYYAAKTITKTLQPLQQQFKTISPQPSRMRLLILYQSTMGVAVSAGLQCLRHILPSYRHIEISLLVYDRQVRLVELEEDGRVIVLNSEAMELINDRFYPMSAGSLDQLVRVIDEESLDQREATINPAVLLGDLAKSIQGETLVLWVGSVPEHVIYFQYPTSPHLHLYAVLRIPHRIGTHSKMEALLELTKHATRVKYLLKTDSDELVTQKVHYEMYEIFYNEAIIQVRVEASRERKYPPEVMTPRQRLLGSLKKNIVVRLGKQVEKDEKIQVRLRYEPVEIQQRDELQPDSYENSQHQPLKPLPLSKKLLIITIRTSQAKHHTQQMYRYLQLFRHVRVLTPQQRGQACRDEAMDDIRHFWRESTYLQKHDLTTEVENPCCIYAVWPWVGVHRAQTVQMKFVFYFTGHYFYGKARKDQLGGRPERGCIEALQTLSQILYSPEEKSLPLYYQHIIDQEFVPEHLVDSDHEGKDQSDHRCYTYQIQ